MKARGIARAGRTDDPDSGGAGLGIRYQGQGLEIDGFIQEDSGRPVRQAMPGSVIRKTGNSHRFQPAAAQV